MLDLGYHSLWGLLILIGDVWAIINIFQSSASNEKKLLWTIVVLVLPLLVWLIKPGFVTRKDLFVGEGVDLSQFTADEAPAMVPTA